MGLNRLLLALLFLGLSYPYVVVNSDDPSDVSSAIFYANAKGEQLYVVYPDADLARATGQIGRQESILLVEPENKAVIGGLRGSLEANGNTIELLSLSGSGLNLELARRSGARSFIISDQIYGYNTVVLIPYARITRSYAIFADSGNVEGVLDFFDTNRPESILLYGSLDGDVVDALQGLTVRTEVIDNGDKYEDNLEILSRYFSAQPNKRDVVFTDGSMMESSIAAGTSPVVLVSAIIPDRLYSFMLEKVREGQIQAGVLVGPEQVNPVYDMMKRINEAIGEKKLSVFVKFGQATTSEGTPQALSTLPMPFPEPVVSLVSASYDPAMESFELIYENTGNANAYVKSSIVVMRDGERSGSVGDQDYYMIRRGEKKGLRYDFPNPGEGQLGINDTTYYGVSRHSPDKGFIKYMDVGRLSFVDQSSLAFSDASYSPMEDKLTFKARNNGSVDVFYRVSVEYINDGLTVYSEEGMRNISAGRNEIITLTGVVQLPEEKAGGADMNITAEYGARDAFLVKRASAPVEISVFPWWILLVLLLLLLAVAYWHYGKKKKVQAKG